MDRQSITKATPILPPLLSRAGNNTEPVISAPKRNWGIHHAKLVTSADPANHQAKEGFHSFFIKENKLCCVLSEIWLTAQRENIPRSIAEACTQRASVPNHWPSPREPISEPALKAARVSQIPGPLILLKINTFLIPPWACAFSKILASLKGSDTGVNSTWKVT